VNEKLNDALNEISDKHIAEAAKQKRSKKVYWMSAAAAVLAAVILIAAFTGPMVIQAEALAVAEDPRIGVRPDLDDYGDRDAWYKDYEAWQAANELRGTTTVQALSQLKPFLTDGSVQFLSGETENRLWSPVNAYIGLAALTELTGGNTRQQILDLLGSKDIDGLRSQVSAVWESVYNDNGHEISRLANSLWLEDGLSCNQETLDALSHHYYASVYRGDLGSGTVNSAIGSWLNNNTGGFLRSAADSIRLPQDAVLALYSTLYFQGKWTQEFSASNNTDGAFHAPGGDVDVTYMNKKLAMMYYYWGDCFSAVSLSLKNGSSMWFILPDEGHCVDDVLTDGTYMDMILSQNWENKKYMKVNLSVPRFDVTGTQNLRAGLEKLGVTDAFSDTVANFTGITTQIPVYLTAANQSVRVQIDEEGVKAAAYIEFPGAMSPAPPDEIIDFVLNRPFLFVITSDNVPLFAGAVNQP